MTYPSMTRFALIAIFLMSGVVTRAVDSIDDDGCGCPDDKAQSDLIRGGDIAQKLAVDVTGWTDLYLTVDIGPDTYSSDQAIWANPILTNKQGESVSLTDLKIISQNVGWGRLFTNINHQNKQLNIAGEKFNKGFWAHGPSVLHFKLRKKYTRFESWVGIGAEAGRKGSVHFKISESAPADLPTTLNKKAPAKPLIAPVADQSPAVFNPEAAAQLIAQGVDKLVFVRRFTLNANHVYSEYVNSKWMPGGGLCTLDLKTGQVTDLLPQLSGGVVNRFDVSYEADRIVFDYKKTKDEGYRIYEINIDGSNLRQLTFPEENEAQLVENYSSPGYHHGTDDLHPCYLPDGGIAFVTTRCQFGVLCSANDLFTTKNLYRMNADGSGMTPLTLSPVSEASPAMLPDGRIIYHRWEYVDKAAGNAKALWAMNPDGTQSDEVYGNTISFPETMIYPRPIPGADGKIVMLGTSHCCPNNAMGAVIVIDTAKDTRSQETMRFVTDDIHALAHNGFHFKDEKGEWASDMTGTKGRLFKDPYPVHENLFIASWKAKGLKWDDPVSYDLCVLNGKGETTLLYDDEAISVWHPYPLKPRVKPPVVNTHANPELAAQDLAQCIVTDIYTGMEGVERGAVKNLRILAEVGRPWASRKQWWADDRDGMAHTAIGEGGLGLKVQFGVVPVEEDGSANFVVPARQNIFFQALDENNLAIQTERTYIHYMPGEIRGCVGCHETSESAPASFAAPLATMRAPSKPQPQTGETHAQKLFDYDRQIQPVWDAHCTSCHDDQQNDGGLDLRDVHQGVYSLSYNNLVALGKTEKRLLGNRTEREEDVASYDISYTRPYKLGAVSSPLAAMLSRGKLAIRDPQLRDYTQSLIDSHTDVALSDTEFLAVTNWLDVNCQYHPSYWGRLNEKFKNLPDYRPNIRFHEALERQLPASLNSLKLTENE
jgi:hypothetical protein